MSESETTLLYVADPMCSWCWGFASVLVDVRARLRPEVSLRHVMGGLAPDSDEPMPPETRAYVQEAWRAVAARTGARFNHDFWTTCEPRRSTYPACRAVLAAERMHPGAGAEMFRAIQRAYYLEARNPSDDDVLIALAGALEAPLEQGAFERLLGSEEVAAALAADLELRSGLGIAGFPSLQLLQAEAALPVTRGWAPGDEVLARLRALEVVR